GGARIATAAPPPRFRTCSPTGGGGGPPTPTMRFQPGAPAPAIAPASMGGPPPLCRAFGRGDFIRGPWPAARITAARSVINDSPVATGAGLAERALWAKRKLGNLIRAA